MGPAGAGGGAQRRPEPRRKDGPGGDQPELQRPERAPARSTVEGGGRWAAPIPANRMRSSGHRQEQEPEGIQDFFFCVP